MIFIDANILLRYLTDPESPEIARMQAVATSLFGLVERGEVSVTTSEVVLHETCYVLTSPRQYGLKVSEVAPVLSGILSWSGFVFPINDKNIYLRALDLWEQHPVLEFSDAVIAARCERGDHELATFDGHFDRVASVRKWSPEPQEPHATPT